MTPHIPVLWRCMAVVEVADHLPDLDDFLHEDGLHYRLEPSTASPKGYRWYELHVDSAGSEHRAARTAWAVLGSLKRLADEDQLEDFRIVSGAEWLNLPTAEPPHRDEAGSAAFN